MLNPKLEDQLQLRIRPIQEQWNGYGRGLLAHSKRLTEGSWIPVEAEVLLVQPILGGSGIAIPSQNRVVLEAVLTNPLPEIPEVIRLLWLILQLNSKEEIYANELAAERLGRYQLWHR